MVATPGQDERDAAWIAAAVGVHFVPLGSAFGQRLLQVSGALTRFGVQIKGSAKAL